MLIPAALINVKIACWENILQSPLTWQQRSNAHNYLSELYWQKYYIKTTVYKKKLFENGTWYLEEDF